MSNRRRAREHILKALYAYEQGEQTVEEIFESIVAHSGIEEKNLEFADRLFGLIIEHFDEINDQIDAIATNWKIQRMAVVDKNILRMAVAELLYMPDIPLKVAVNEAIELAKKYSTYESASFVNGILDKIMHEHPDIEPDSENENEKQPDKTKNRQP